MLLHSQTTCARGRVPTGHTLTGAQAWRVRKHGISPCAVCTVVCRHTVCGVAAAGHASEAHRRQAARRQTVAVSMRAHTGAAQPRKHVAPCRAGPARDEQVCATQHLARCAPTHLMRVSRLSPSTSNTMHTWRPCGPLCSNQSIMRQQKWRSSASGRQQGHAAHEADAVGLVWLVLPPMAARHS